jgi:hypothetical protein
LPFIVLLFSFFFFFFFFSLGWEGIRSVRCQIVRCWEAGGELGQTRGVLKEFAVEGNAGFRRQEVEGARVEEYLEVKLRGRGAAYCRELGSTMETEVSKPKVW